MTLSPLNFRLPEFTRTGSVLSQLGQNLQSISDLQQQIASGQRVDAPSDDPIAVRRILSYDRWIQRSERYEANIQLADSRLATTEGSLQELSNVITRARDLALQLVGDTATADQRANAAIEVGQLVEEAVTLANRQFGDRYLFGGSEVGQPPFERIGDYVAYNGDEQSSSVAIAVGILFDDAITGAAAFGGLSSEVVGQNDLDPVLTNATRLSSLNGGRGIDLAEFEIRNGLQERVFVDLSGANTVGDVIDRLNATGLVTAQVDAAGQGLEITAVDPAADLDVLDVGGRTAARDLGIQGLNQGNQIAGLDLDRIATATTALADLFGGSGLDLAGFRITNGNNPTDISLAGAETLEDVLTLVERSGQNVVAEITADGRSLAIRSSLAGAELTIEELGGTTAADLGLVVDVEDLLLESLNGGTGVQDLPGDDFTVRLADGTQFSIDIQSASTLGDIRDLLVNAPGNVGRLDVQLLDGPPRFVLTDTTAGAEEFSVLPESGSFAAAQLGIQAVGVAGVIDGGDVSPAGTRLSSIFDGLTTLQRSLQEDDRSGIEAALRVLDRTDDRVFQARGQLGIRVRRLEISRTRIEIETTQLLELRSQDADTDLASAIVQFQQQQTVYQAALQTAGQFLQPSLFDFLG